MALTGNITSKLVETLARGVVANSAYLTRDTVGVPGLQPGMRTGQEYQFVMNSIQAQDFSGDGDDLTDGGVTFETASLAVKSVGVQMALSKLDKALMLGDFKALTKEIAPAIANEFAKQVATSDIQKIDNVVCTGSEIWKTVAKKASSLKAKWQGKVNAFASPEIVGELIGEGRNFQPVNVEPQFMNGLEGKLYSIDEFRNMILPTSSNSRLSASQAITKGSEITVANIKKGEFLVGKSGAVAVSLEDGKATGIVTGNIVADDLTKTYAPCIMRVTGAQAWQDASQCLDGMDVAQSDVVEGVKVVMEKRPGNKAFGATYNFAVAGVSGIADAKKALVLWCEV